MRSLWIDGGLTAAAEGRTRGIYNPATLELVDDVTEASAADVRRACAAAADAQRHWRRVPALERGKLLHETAALMRADRAELSRLLTLEGGKPRIENLDEVEWCAACFRVLRRDRPQLARLVDSADRRASDQLHDQRAARRRRRDRAVQLSAAAARLEDRARARGRQLPSSSSPRS